MCAVRGSDFIVRIVKLKEKIEFLFVHWVRISGQVSRFLLAIIHISKSGIPIAGLDSIDFMKLVFDSTDEISATKREGKRNETSKKRKYYSKTKYSALERRIETQI